MFEPFIAASIVALISLIGIVTFRNSRHASAYHTALLPLSIGAFLAVTFLELIPEAFHESEYASYALAGGFFGFLLLSRLVREYHHHHSDECEVGGEHRARGPLVLIGDAVHNFADGVVIAAAFSVDTTLGIAVTFGIALHEIPQEIAELYILESAGYSRARALVLNFMSALTVILGALLGSFFIETFEALLGIILGVAAGNLLYIAASDLIPNMNSHAPSASRLFWKQFLLACLGFALIGALLVFAHEEHEKEMADTHSLAVVEV